MRQEMVSLDRDTWRVMGTVRFNTGQVCLLLDGQHKASFCEKIVSMPFSELTEYYPVSGTFPTQYF